VLVLFGSASDRGVYEPLRSALNDREVSHDFRVCSAHKSPRYLDSLLQDAGERYALVIAGAGLAAHLPGVVASRLIQPVVGVPVNAALGGADALLSVLQMPPGVPVLAVGVDQAAEAAAAAGLLQREGISLLDGFPEQRVSSAKALCERFGIELLPPGKGITIAPAPLGSRQQGDILVPLAERSDARDIGKLMEMTRSGLWVGINRLDNAVLAAVELLNARGAYTRELLAYRAELEEQYAPH